MTRQKKELIRRIDEIEAFISADSALGCGFAVNEEQAKTVRHIYERFLAGVSLDHLAIEMNEEGCWLTGKGSPVWGKGTLKKVLTNIKYTGDVRTGMNNAVSAKNTLEGTKTAANWTASTPRKRLSRTQPLSRLFQMQ